MEQITGHIVSGFFGAIFICAIWAYQYNRKRGDDSEVHTLNGLGARITDLEKQNTETRVQLERRVTWDEMAEFRKDLRQEIKAGYDRLEAAIISMRNRE